MRRIVAHGRSDVGICRNSNEDALLLRETVFAVADGMGGHLAGEVASVAALEPIEVLDGKVFASSTQAATALADAVTAANAHVMSLAAKNPQFRGMGTTLTAVLVEGVRLHVAHVGDSRAYLLRNDTLSQLTIDHTLVQQLIDDGKITAEEAAKHPQRSVITRALGIAPVVDVDTLTVTLAPGDTVLLCSDGLTGVVADDTIVRTLMSADTPSQAIDALIASANANGGPDNVTVLVLTYEDDTAETATPTVPLPIPIRSRADLPDSDFARDLGRVGMLGRSNQLIPSGSPTGRSMRSIFARAAAIVLGVSLLLSVIVGGGQFLLSRSVYVGVDAGEVVIFRGVNADIGRISLSQVYERSGIPLDDVLPYYHPILEAGRPATDVTEARSLLRDLPLKNTDPAPNQTRN
ncbi:MAG: Stp1/IreP family PP2C-type Ser/Thr phosphatase [Nitriliruptoraceae bacterium]